MFVYNFEIKVFATTYREYFFPGAGPRPSRPGMEYPVQGEPLTPIWAATQVHGTIFVQLKGVRREYIRHCSKFSDFWYFCAKLIFLVRFLRIHPVQSVVSSPTQLSGRGFPCVFYMKLFVSQLYVFLVLQNGRRTV